MNKSLKIIIHICLYDYYISVCIIIIINIRDDYVIMKNI